MLAAVVVDKMSPMDGRIMTDRLPRGLAVRALTRIARGVCFDSHPKLNFSVIIIIDVRGIN